MNRFKIKDLRFRNGVLILIILTSYYLLPTATHVLAQTDYKLLAPIPLSGAQSGDSQTAKASDYIKGIFMLVIAIATGLAVIMIIFGGIKYMSTDAFAGKSEAKTTIEHALWGLLLAISAWLILNTINPKLTTFNLSVPVQSIPANTNLPVSSVGGATGGLGLTQQQAMSQFDATNIDVDGGISLAGIKQSTVNEIARLKLTCGCDITITSATSGVHAPGTFSHANGYKADLRLNDTLTSHITGNYTSLLNRSDGAKMYLAPSGAIYALESNHWDISVPGL